MNSRVVSWGDKMPVKRENKLYSLISVSPDLEAHKSRLADIEAAIGEIETNYQIEISKIENNFDLFAMENKKTFERYEEDFTQVLRFIDHEYESLFQALDDDFVAHRQNLEGKIANENAEFQKIVDAFEDLKAEAFKSYTELCKKSENAITQETEIHQRFIDEKNHEFEATKEKYNAINNQQYDTLLWTMEKSKNALSQLGRSLNEQAFNDTKFMNQAVTKILESLRDSKNKITALFKTSTLSFSNKKNRIDELSEIRQIPYSEINQSLIDQYVRQIASVNQKKLNFDNLVQEDYLRSSMVVGKKIIEADQAKKYRLTKKYIMQYGIIKSKSNYLLNRNQQLSDLLISKYQNEIRKIKVESFRRVEEIKLAYSLPSQFFQNSVDLYSNFAFYVSESLDEIDNMLTDFLRFNQNISQTFVDYIKSSTKTFEDYKINCLVTVNNVTAKMTDLITEIDFLSKEIVSVESKNRLEVAQVKKDMENADISGDYEKYIAGLKNDRLLADFQHDANLKTVQSLSDNEASLLVIQREVTERNKQKQVDEALVKHDRLISKLEKDIHDQAYDKELALLNAKHARDLALVDLEEQKQQEEETFAVLNQKNLLKQTYDQHKDVYQGNKNAGSDFVVDFVHQTQSLIDLKKNQTANEIQYLENSPSSRAFAYLLELRRKDLHDQLRFRTKQLTDPHEKAIHLFDHLLFMTRSNIDKQIGKYSLALKHLLANLNESNAAVQAEALSLEHFYRYDVLTVFKNSRETVASLISPDQNAALLERANRILDEDFKKVAILTTVAEKNSLMSVKSPRGLKKTLLAFYVEMITLLDLSQNHVHAILDDLEECLIKNDVLMMKKYEDEMDKKKKIIDQQFDENIFSAFKKKVKPVIFSEQVALEYRDIETILADRVVDLNKTYLNGLKEQERSLNGLEKELAKKAKEHEKNKNETLSTSQKAKEKKKQKLLEIQERYMTSYELLKKQNLVAMNEENNRFSTQLSVQSKAREKSIEALTQTVTALPKKHETLVMNLEMEKTKFMKEHEQELRQELSHLEEQKFVARPAYLTKMAQIRERLPEDYMNLYKQVANAQNSFVKEYETTNVTYSQGFNRFLSNQVEYNSILFNDSVLLHPYERFLMISDRLKARTEEVIKDTVSKSASKHDQMKKQSTDSEENQNRIINA